jgi:quercetin dioxygenase-like cupin family protein
LSAQSYVVEETSVPVEREDDSGVSWRTLTSADRTPTRELTSGVCEIEPGGELVLHRHPVLELYYFLEGTGVVRLDDVERAVKAGVTVSIPADLPHGIRNTGTSVLKLFYVFPTDSFSQIVYTNVDRRLP